MINDVLVSSVLNQWVMVDNNITESLRYQSNYYVPNGFGMVYHHLQKWNRRISICTVPSGL